MKLYYSRNLNPRVAPGRQRAMQRGGFQDALENLRDLEHRSILDAREVRLELV